MKSIKLFLIFSMIITSSCDIEDNQNFDWGLREGFPLPQLPVENQITNSKVNLGRHLFYDKKLSANQTQSCATCHQQSHAFAEPLTISVGSTGQLLKRNSPALVNIAYNKTLTWAHDGINTIERQLLIPMFNEAPIELGITGHEAEVLNRFTTTNYQKLFERAFGKSYPTFDKINQAIASFVRSLISLNSPFDRYAYDGQDNALTESQLNGMTLFFSERLECHHCHGGFNFTQSTFHEKQILDRRPFHNTGLYFIEEEQGYPKVDKGLREVTGTENDDGRFRAPTLRNITHSAPYMHDGSIKTLEEVIDFYAAGGRIIEVGEFAGDGRLNPLKSPFIKGFELTPTEKQDLINFLHSLTDEEFLTNEKFSDPFLSAKDDKSNDE